MARWEEKLKVSEKLSFIYILIAGFGLMALAGVGQAEDRKIACMRLCAYGKDWFMVGCENNPLKPQWAIAAFASLRYFQAVWGMEQFFSNRTG